MSDSTCLVDGCDAPSKTRGHCSRHYQKLWRYGDPLGGVVDPTSCKRCGDKIPPKVNPHGPGSAYCSKRCQDAQSYERQKVAGTRKLKREAQRLVECGQCGTEFKSARSVARFCSPKCNKAFHRQSSTKSCNSPNCSKPLVARGLCGTHYNRKFHPNSQKLYPGDPEVKRRADRIWTAKRRALMTGADAENVDRELVGLRDGWLCGICGRRIDPALTWPHPKSQSLDHVVPLSLGGQHTYLNTRITHLRCNVRRNNKPEADQLNLFGT